MNSGHCRRTWCKCWQQNVAVGEVVRTLQKQDRREWGLPGAIKMPRLAEHAVQGRDPHVDRGECGRIVCMHRVQASDIVDDENDNEEAGENAREIKQTVMAQGVDGRALLHLTIEDMEKIGEKAGRVEGGGECALKLLGHRIAILNSIHAFVEAHKDEPWDRVKNLTLLTRQGQDNDKDESELTTGSARRSASTKFKDDSDAAALLRHGAQVQQAEGAEAAKVVVPVFASNW